MEFCSRCLLVYASDDLVSCEICGQSVCAECRGQLDAETLVLGRVVLVSLYTNICDVHIVFVPQEEVTQ